MSPAISPPPVGVDVVLCPSCGHGIDPHGIDPGGICGVGDEQGRRCPCLWSPNDIAGTVCIWCWPDNTPDVEPVES